MLVSSSMRTLLTVLLFYSAIAEAQNKYGLRATTFDEYVASVKVNPEKELIDLEKFIPSLVLDIRYATSNNFTGEKIYTLGKSICAQTCGRVAKENSGRPKAAGIGNKDF